MTPFLLVEMKVKIIYNFYMLNSQSKAYFKRAERLFVGGVNSPVRAFGAVGGTPVCMRKGKGAWLWDVDGNRYLDFVLSWGPLILGHARKEVVRAVKRAVTFGASFGACSELELELAELLVSAMPSLEKVRFVSSGTEAVMTAIRLARGFTGKDKIIKFIGCYHGHSDSLLIKAGSGAATMGIPDSAGVPKGLAQETLALPYNDFSAVRSAFQKYGDEIAAVLVEPLACNMGVVPPVPGYLEFLRRITRRYKAILIFDEVITGFRLSFGGAQEYYKIKPDLTCLGKIIGGGLPAGALGGSKKVMDVLAPLGPVYQAGTLSGNPAAMSAGVATLKILKKEQPYPILKERTEMLLERAQTSAKKWSLPLLTQQVESLFTFFFTSRPVHDYAGAKEADTARYARFFHSLLNKGIYFPPSQFEACNLSLAHSRAQLDFAAKSIEEVMVHG